MANQQPKAEGLLRLNLQHFAEGGTPPEGTPPEGTPPEGATPPEGTPPADDKTFSQEDVNNIAAREAKKAQEKVFKDLGIEDFETAKEGMTKFQEWQEAQKTDADRQAEKLTQLEKSQADVQSENETFKAQISAMKAGVNTDSVEDVVTLAKNLVGEDVDMVTAIKQVIEKYPHFADGTQEEEEEGKPSFSKGKHSKKTGEDSFANILLGK